MGCHIYAFQYPVYGSWQANWVMWQRSRDNVAKSLSQRVWTHRERQRERQATKMSLVATTHAWNYKNFKKFGLSLEKLSLVACVLWVHLRFPLILQKDSLTRHDKQQFCCLTRHDKQQFCCLTRHDKRQFCCLSLPVRSYPICDPNAQDSVNWRVSRMDLVTQDFSCKFALAWRWDVLLP